MDESLKHELYFLIAKLLKSEFPDIGELFIHECQEHKLFPSLVFNDHPSFDQLEKTSLPDIPNDQLIKLIQLSCPHSQYPSLFFNASRKFIKPSLATCLSAHIFPRVSPFHDLTPQIRIIGHTNSVYCLAFDVTNQLLITGSDDDFVKVWNYSTNTILESFNKHSNEISDVQVHPSNGFFAVSSLDCSISVISLLDFSVITTKELGSKVHVIRFSPDGKYMAAALEEGNVKVLKAPTCEEFYTIPSPNKKAVAWLSFSPGGEFLAFAADPCDIVIFSMSTLKTEQICHEHNQPPEFISFSRSSCKQIISCSYQENCVKLLEFNPVTAKWAVGPKGDLVIPHNNGHRPKVIRVSFNCDDSNIVAISKNSISCWETQTKCLINTASNEIFTDCCTSLAMHPHIPNIAFVGCKSGRASIWDTNLGEVIVPLQSDYAYEITEAIWSNDGLSVVAADENGGFTKFAYNNNSKKFFTIDQFFLSDFTGESNDHSKVTDIQLQPLVPQPKISKISDFNLNIKLPEIRKEIISEEEEIVKRWKNPSFELINSFIEESSDDDDSDEENNNKRSESISSFNFADKPITSSRMSTRHSISMFDESFDLDLDSDPNVTFRFSNASSSVIYNTRSRARRRDQIRKLRNQNISSSSDDEFILNFRKNPRNTSDDESSIIKSPASEKGKRKGNSNKRRNGDSSQSSYEYYYEEEEENENEEEEENEEDESEEDENEEDENEEDENEEDESKEYEYEYEYENEYEDESKSESENENYVYLSSESDLEDKVVTITGRKSTATHSFSPEPPKRRIRITSKRDKKDEKKKENPNKKEEKQASKTSTPKRKETNIKSAPSSQSRNIQKQNKSPNKLIRRKLMDSPVTTISGRTTTIHRSFSPEPALSKRKTSHKQEHDKGRSKISQVKATNSKATENNLPKFSKNQKIPSKVPEYITFDTQRIKTYVPQRNDSVVYLRDSHQIHLEECLCYQYSPPFQFMDNFPSIVFATVLKVDYNINSLLVTIKINEPKKVGKIVKESLIYLPYPLAPDVLIERSKYENVMTMARSLTVKHEIEVIKTDQKISKGYLIARDKEWLTNPYQSLTVQFEENDEKCNISPWDVLFPIRRMNPTPAQRLCSQIRPFLKSLSENDDYDVFKDWKLCDLDKVLISKKIRPVDLSLLMRRTTNNYYRTTEELIDDVDRLKKTLLLISPKRKSEIQEIIDSINEVIEHGIERLHIQLSNQK